MSKIDRDPARFLTDFFTSFTADALRSDADPAGGVDRYHTPDVVQVADGVRLDRERLIAHLRPIRKNLQEYRFDVHEAVADGDTVAARLTIHGRMRTSGTVATLVHLFAEFAPDGRLRRAHQLTRTLAGDEAATRAPSPGA
jgi:predicted ester cyclase